MDRLLRGRSIRTLLLVVTLPICSEPGFRISGKVHAVCASLSQVFVQSHAYKGAFGGSHVTGIDSMSIS